MLTHDFCRIKAKSRAADKACSERSRRERPPYTGKETMSCRLRGIVISVLCVAACLPVTAQNSLNQMLQPPTTASHSSNTAADPLGRETPSGTVFGFLQAAQSGNYSTAAQYLQMSPARRQSEGAQMASKLKLVMDRAFAGSLRNISTQPEGAPQEGVPMGRQKLGTMASGDVEADLELVRVSDPGSGKIWLISSDTLAKVPELYDQVEARQVESRLPSALVKHRFAGMTLWQWLALLVALPIAAGLGWLILALLEIPMRWWARRRGQHDVANWRAVSGPTWLLAGTAVHRTIAAHLGMPLLQRHYYVQVTSIAFIIGANWIFWRAIQWFMRRVRTRALARGHGGTGSLMLLGERIVKAAVFVAAVLAIFSSLGFNMSTALAGLGIGGLAIGFGAQKTIENQTNLTLRPETEPDHLRFVLSEVRRLLYSHAKVETASVRVRLTDIVSSSYTVEVFCYILTQDFNEFAAVREDIFLHMIRLVGESGTGFALPSQTLYLGRDSGLEKEKAQNAVKKIAELRDGKQLPFPDFAEKEISSFRGSIDYPQPESALRNEKPDSEPKH